MLSFFLYSVIHSVVQQEIEIEESSKKAYKICRYTIFKNVYTNQELDNPENEQNKEENEEENKKKKIDSIQYTHLCLRYLCCSLCFLFKSLFFAIKNCCDEIICRFLCCGKKGAKCCCCICIKDINEREYNSNRHFFCYCYQEQGRCKWLNTCIRNKAQKKLLPIMLQFFILQLTTIGLEKAYNDINESSDFNNFEEKKI